MLWLILSSILALTVAILIHWLYFLTTRRRDLPPGPLPLPIIGSAWIFAFGDPLQVIDKLHEKYGNYCTIYAGYSSINILVLEHDAIVDMWTGDKGTRIVERSADLNQLRGIGEGIIWARWRVAQERRRLLLRIFRDQQLIGSRLSQRVFDDVEGLFGVIDHSLGQPIDIGDLIRLTTANAATMALFSKPVNDPDFAGIVEATRYWFDKHFAYVVLAPFIMANLPFGKDDPSARMERRLQALMTKWANSELENRRKNFNPDLVRDYLDAYVAAEREGSASMSLEELGYTMSDLYIGATHTTSTATLWMLFYLAHLPEEQERLFKEISRVVPINRHPDVADKSKMPRLDAFFNESMRYSTFMMITLPRMCSDEIKFGPKDCYTLPRNGGILISLQRLNRDRNYWLDPENFRVDRWIDVDSVGKVELKRHGTHFATFGGGRRVCPGETVARNIATLLLASIVRRYKLTIAKPSPAFSSYSVRLNVEPLPYRLAFSARD